MTATNDMRSKIMAAFEAVGRECAVEWVEVDDGECGGSVWVQRCGGFQTLLRLDYDFQPRCCRLSLVRDGKQVAGRCGIRYDDAATIEDVLDRFRRLLKTLSGESAWGTSELPGNGNNGQTPPRWEQLS